MFIIGYIDELICCDVIGTTEKCQLYRNDFQSKNKKYFF